MCPYLDYFIETVVYKKPLADFHGMNNMWPFIEVKKIRGVILEQKPIFQPLRFSAIFHAQPTIRDS